MFYKILILAMLTKLSQAWFLNRCIDYKHRHDFCAVLFTDEDCKGYPIFIPKSPLVNNLFTIKLSFSE